jgi:hypothetical protein
LVAISLRADGVTTFCYGLGDDLGFEGLLGIHLLEAAVFLLQLFEARHERGIHATEFGAPLVKVAVLMPCSRQSSGTGEPDSACLRMAMIWASLKRDVVM